MIALQISDGERGKEIKQYLDTHTSAENFIILDDEIGDISTEFDDNHIVHTTFYGGFNKYMLQEAFDKLDLELKPLQKLTEKELDDKILDKALDKIVEQKLCVFVKCKEDESSDLYGNYRLLTKEEWKQRLIEEVENNE